MKQFIVLVSVFLSFNSISAGFSGGDIFKSTNIEGNLSVTCVGNQPGPNMGNAYCRMNFLTPGEYSFFIGPKIDADKVTLQAIWENGKKSKPKTENYDGVQGKSKKSFNLWIATLFQRPLLDFGTNTVQYTLTKNGQTVEQGEFEVKVISGSNRICTRHGHYVSTNTQDCTNASQYCDTYFRENNYCN